MQGPLISTSTRTAALQLAVVVSIVLHAVFGSVAWVIHEPLAHPKDELVDIEIAPLAPKAEALPAEVARAPEEGSAATRDEVDPAATAVPVPPEPGEGFAIDAGVDAPPDAAPDAPPDAAPDARPDAPVDAGFVTA